MILRAVSKYRVSRSRTSSASRLSERLVNPTRSAKRTDTSRRSAAGAAEGWGWALGTTSDGAVAARGDPHSPQNFTVVGFGAPQFAQTRASGVPHSPQNLRPGSFSVPQAEQIN